MNKTDSIANLGAALAKAQGELQTAKFDASNEFLKNKYATLGSIIEASRQPLSKYELAISQHPITNETGAIGVETILIHSSGEWISSELYLAIDGEKGTSSAQVLGSIITYLRRYALASILGVYADDDTDANDPKPEQKAQPAQKPQPTNGKPQAQPAPQPELHSLMTLEMAATVTNSDGMLYTDIDSEKLSNMTIGINKALKKPDLSEKEREQYLLKRDAIAVILASRNG